MEALIEKNCEKEMTSVATAAPSVIEAARKEVEAGGWVGRSWRRPPSEEVAKGWSRGRFR